jgi:CarboxypepD_reg-like domain
MNAYLWPLKSLIKLGVRNKIFAFCIAALSFCAVQEGYSQSRRVVQLSGIILSNDSINGLPGAHIYVPKAGRGTTSNNTGFFSLPVQTGDSVVISSVGFVRRSYIVPQDAQEFTTIIVEMVEDVTYLPAVKIMPFPTEEVFKEAVLALNIPMDQNGVDSKNLNAELMALMARTTPMDGAANYRYYMSQYPQSIQNKFMPITNPFLNVFNWSKFFKQLKKNKEDDSDK